MNSSRPLALLIAFLAALAAVFFIWSDRNPTSTEGPPAFSKPAEIAFEPGSKMAPKPLSREEAVPVDAGAEAKPETGPGMDPDPVGGPAAHSATPEARDRSKQRMEQIGRQWLRPFAAETAMPESQEAKVWEVVKAFIVAYEALRWRREVEEDVETTIERLYGRAERDIRALLGTGQEGSFRGLPRDWGFNLLDPGPGR
ncbi:MAG: hypothetical protein AAB074_07290 [Planctomycetota bacterium]